MQNTGGPVPLHTRLTFRRTSESGGSSGIRLSPARLLARPSCCAAAVARWSGCTSSSYLCRPHLRPASRTPCRICQPAATVDKQATWAKEGVCGGSGSTNERTNEQKNERTHAHKHRYWVLQHAVIVPDLAQFLVRKLLSFFFFFPKKVLSWLQQTKFFSHAEHVCIFVWTQKQTYGQTIWLSISFVTFILVTR